jgi:uncharacterized protein (DUF302 family)
MTSTASLVRTALTAALLAAFGTPSAHANSTSAHISAPLPHADGVLRLRSANAFDETLVRLKADVQAKGIRLFDTIDQSGLGAQAGLKTTRSTLVLFGNPPLGVQFLQSNPYAGLDWPVRMLVLEDSDGSVWVAWSDFGFVRQRYGIADKDAQFRMAGEVAAAATSR